MAGIADPSKPGDTPGAKDSVKYARTLAECGPRSTQEKEAFAEFAKVYGEGRASSLQAVCWFLHWGSFTGNTLNGMIGIKNNQGKEAKQTGCFFKLTFFLYYFPLFFILINLVGCLLKPLPKVPACVCATMGFVLALTAGIWFFPLGVIGIIVCAKPPIQDYEAIPSGPL